jgi:hypothetical protein
MLIQQSSVTSPQRIIVSPTTIQSYQLQPIGGAHCTTEPDRTILPATQIDHSLEKGT